MSIKLLALDLDGTTLNSRGEIASETRDAIRNAEEAGVLVTIATGRRFRDARPVGLELGLNARYQPFPNMIPTAFFPLEIIPVTS